MVGSTLSHYKILEELGRGGMGIVYKAEDTKLDRTVAIKVLPSAALASEDDRARFYREARAAASLSHPNIAVIHEIDEAVPEGSKDDDLRPFIAMEYIEGDTLKARIEKGPLKLKEATRIAAEVATGLKAAHDKNIVHRDIKSGNIMVDENGTAKILDFGLAQTAKSTKLTQMGSTLGTVAFMSPEQARGDEVDLRTDLWSLGVVLYEMIAGRSPFPGDYEQAVVYEILNQDPEPLTGIRTGVPMDLEAVVNKCLAKDPELRYPSADGLIVDLKRIEASSAVRTTSVSTQTSTIATAVPVPAPSTKLPWMPLTAAGVVILVDSAIIVDGKEIFGPRDLPRVAVAEPIIRPFHLVAVLDPLPEDAVFVAYSIAVSGQSQRCHRIEETSGQPSQPAVAQPGVPFQFDQFFQVQALLRNMKVLAQLLDRLLAGVVQIQVDQTRIQRSANEELQRKIINPLDIGVVVLLLRQDPT